MLVGSKYLPLVIGQSDILQRSTPARFRYVVACPLALADLYHRSECPIQTAHAKRVGLTRQRTRIIGNAEEPWFNIFSVIFEIVSAYGTVGLSLGSSNANFS